MSFTGQDKILKSLADAAETVLEGKVNVYELAAELTDEDAASFIAAAAHAKKEGKSHFMFNGKDYPVTIGDDVAKQVEDKLDPVGKEDDDVDNDGDVDDSDEYLKKRRDAIDKAIDDEEEEVEEGLIDFVRNMQVEAKDSGDDEPAGVYTDNDEVAPGTDTGVAGQDDVEVKDGEEEESEKPEVKKEAVEGDSEEDDGVEGAEDPDKDVEDNVTTSKAADPKASGAGSTDGIDDEDDAIDGAAPISKESFESFDDVWGLIENLRPKNPNKKSTIDIDIHNPAQAKAAMAKFGLKPGTVGRAGGASTIKVSGKNKDLLAYLTSKEYDMDKEDIKDLFGKDILEAYGLDEGRMKELHGHIEDGKSAEEIIKLMKLKKTPDMIKFIKGLMK